MEEERKKMGVGGGEGKPHRTAKTQHRSRGL